MCLIIASEIGEVPTTEILHNAYQNNKDGWGVVRAIGNGVLDVQKGFDETAFQHAMEACKGVPYVAHLRWATHGKVNTDNCHPFKVNRNLWMAHNGVIPIQIRDKSRSDTWHFVEDIIKPAIKQGYDILPYVATLEEIVGRSNKLAFLDVAGRVTLVNEKAGDWQAGIWYSNTYSLDTPWCSTDWTDEEWERWVKTGRINLPDSTFDDNNPPSYFSDGSDRCDYCGEPIPTEDVVTVVDGYTLCDPCYNAEYAYDKWANGKAGV